MPFSFNYKRNSLASSMPSGTPVQVRAEEYYVQDLQGDSIKKRIARKFYKLHTKQASVSNMITSREHEVSSAIFRRTASAPAREATDSLRLSECSVKCKRRTTSVTMSLPLPQGCAVGIPSVVGVAATPLEGKSLPVLAINFVQRDDYHGLLELARRGASDAITDMQRCSFVLALKPENSVMSDLPASLQVHGANLLHYAVCIGSFRAAAALVVVNPDLFLEFCTVNDSVKANCEEIWCVTELARLFCVLYEGENENCDDKVLATRLIFKQALRVLERCTDCPERMPSFVQLPTVHMRMDAAGWDSEVTIQAFFAA